MIRRTLVVVAILGMAISAPLLRAQQAVVALPKELQLIVASKGKEADSKRLKDFFAADWKRHMVEHPEAATYYGYPGQNGRWSDFSEANIAKQKREAGFPLIVLKSIDRSKLSPADQINYDLYVYDTERNVEESKFPSEYLFLNQMGGVQIDTAGLMSLMPANNAKDYSDILDRLRGLAKLIDQHVVLLRQGLAAGITPPKVVLGDVRQQIQNQIVENAQDSPLLRKFENVPEGLSEQKEALRNEAKKIYAESVRPAFQRLLDFISTTYLPKAVSKTGFSALPKGKEWYRLKARLHTTTELTPEEIHEIGLGEVKRIRAQMELVQQQAGFRGTFPEFLQFLRTDDQFFFKTPNELLMGYRDICKRADPELARLFGTLPRLPYGVQQVPSYSEKSQTTAYYEPGSPDVGRPGFFFANTYDLRSRPKWEMEALSLHEAVPGHHLQIALAQEMQGLPEFRRFGEYTAFVEGWGLYSESLGSEMGFYKDPYARFGQLTYEMWRSIRLVVDTGMHYLGWSRQQAIDYFVQNAGKSEHDITVEVDRYLVWPGQALAYKIGELKIKQLRAEAQKELGDRFDIRKFHDAVLSQGAVPLNLLEAQIRKMIAAEKGNSPSDQRSQAQP